MVKTLKDRLLEGGIKGKIFRNTVQFTNIKEGTEYVVLDLIELNGIAHFVMCSYKKKIKFNAPLSCHYEDPLVGEIRRTQNGDSITSTTIYDILG